MPGATSKDVEQRVTSPMEKLIWEVPGVEYVYSTSSPGQSMVVVRFLVGQDQEKAFVRLREKLQSHFDAIPPGASQPIIKPHSIDDVPVLALTLHSATVDSYTLRQIATSMEQAVKSVPDVSETTLIGGRRRELAIHLDRDKLASQGLSVDQVLQAVGGANHQSLAGTYSSGDKEVVVVAGGFFKSRAEVEETVVSPAGSKPVKAKDKIGRASCRERV